MILQPIFRKVFAELEKKLNNENFSPPYDYVRILIFSIELWGERLKLESDQISYVKRFARISKTVEIFDYIYNEWDYLEKYTEWESFRRVDKERKNRFGNYIQEKVKNIMEINLKMFTFILLVAFVFTGIGLILYLLDKNESAGDNHVLKPSILVVSSPPQILILIINAENQRIIQSLNKGQVIQSEAEELYRATGYLWIGSKNDFAQSVLARRFSSENLIEETEESEYDVYFVKIELTQPVPGFEANVNQTNRTDAFNALPKVSGKVEVSPRLSSSAYGNTPVYSR